MNFADKMRDRTKRFALLVIKLYSELPKTNEYQVIGRQFLRSGTSIGAQFREGIRAKSRADLISKTEGCLQELEETAYWLELLQEMDFNKTEKLQVLLEETNELIKIFVTSANKLKKNTHNS